MSAGTEGFIDTRLDTNHIGAVIGKILEARKLAETEREYAERQAEKYQTSVEEAGYGKGYFFKQALRFKFGGEYKQKKLAQLNTFKQRGKLLKTAISGKSGQNKLDGTERTQALFDMFNTSDKPKTFRDKFKDIYSGFVDDPMTRPRSKLIDPSSAKKIQKATTSRSRSRVNKEDILGSLSSIVGAIEKIAQSISEKNRIVSEQMIHSSALQGMVHTQLKTSGDTLEDKLQKIIDVLSNQTQLQSQSLINDKNKSTESNLEAQKDSASSVSFDDLTTKENESKTSSPDAYAERDKWRDQMMSEMMSGTSGAEKGAISNNTLPKAEKGGIFSGPDSGYLAELHGNEMVVPLDNNYTQGEPSAVDGKVRPKPMTTNNVQKFEMGTKNTMFNSFPKYEIGSKSSPNSSPITSKFGFDTAKNQMGIASGGTKQQSNMAQSMVDVMSLPMMAAGGTILSATTRYLQSLGGEGANISPEIERIARPIAETFGLPPSIVNKVKQKSFNKSSVTSGEEGGESGKNILAKLMDGFGAMLDKMKENINNTPPPPPGPGTTGPGVDFSGNQPSVEIPVKQSVMDQFESTENYSTYRETLAAKESGGSYSPRPTPGGSGGGGGDGNYEGRYQINHTYLDDYAAKLGEKAPTREQFRKDPKQQERFMQEYTMENKRILEAYSPKFKKMAKKEQMAVLAYAHSQGASNAANWVETGMGAGTADGFGTKGRTYYENVKKNLNTPTRSAANPTPPTQPPDAKATTAQLGQAITGNYGLKLGQERTFNHPEYGEIKAHKTATGFDFYKNNTILNVSPSTPQGKSIVDYFKSTEGGIKDISPPKNNTSPAITPKDTSSTGSGSGNIAMLNIGGGSKTSTAGSSSQPTGENGTEPGYNPTQNFYSNPFAVGVG